ncbi:ABC transporter ATP-binding protein [Rhodoligotrophos ferricapiens]|uniref:ABC transporter ATP-binding protein n=1 Tax=Rhodoligotrophos ferricapiens TaxID=3069264 RepID=UPI00315CF021
MSDVRLTAVKKWYGRVLAVNGISLSVDRGEMVSFLGPSGCGKTTTLRMIAGLEEPDEGEITIRNTRVNNVPTYRRNIGMVFQNYALFPHMTVYQNIAFGLSMRKQPRSEIDRNVKDVMRLVRLDSQGDRLPSQLSGGQRQRVALARAIVTKPDVLLLDEPLGALDKKLREQMQIEIRSLQREVGITTIFVTHDQEEALTLSDRIVVMESGCIVQVGTPEQIYRQPATPFVSDFIGISNALKGRVETVEAPLAKVRLQGSGSLVTVPHAAGIAVGQEVSVLIRPENIVLSDLPSEGFNVATGTVTHVIYTGALTYYHLTDGASLRYIALATNAATGAAGAHPSIGETVTFGWGYEASRLLPAG